MPSLLGKLAIVTGGGSGIGKAACGILIRDGAKVIVADKNYQLAKDTVNELGKDFAIAAEVDVASSKSVSRLLEFSIKEHKRPPSIIVNSAGITRDCWLLKMLENDFDSVYNVNLKGTFLMTQQFAKAMVEHNVSCGSIINISSIVATINSMGQANYAATKAGVISFTKVACKELGKFNIRVNAIMPGFIQTPMINTVPEPIKNEIISRCPLKRLGNAEEIAEVITFLASEKSSYVNGATIEITGGLS